MDPSKVQETEKCSLIQSYVDADIPQQLFDECNALLSCHDGQATRKQELAAMRQARKLHRLGCEMKISGIAGSDVWRERANEILDRLNNEHDSNSD